MTDHKLEAVRVRMLGGFSVSVGSRVLEENAWRLKNAAALVKLLALAPNHRLHREQVMDLLWPATGRKDASNSLRRILHSARGALDPVAGSRYLASRDDSLVLCPGGSLWVDLESFEEAAATARRGRDPAACRAAIELYAGDLLPGDRYEGWAEEKRGELRRLYLDLLLELARAYEDRGDLGRAVETLRVTAAKEPTLEEAHAGLMRLYALSGRESEALVQYERLREALSGRLGMEPGTRIRSLHEDIASGKFPTTASQHAGFSQEEAPDAGKHNLPAPRSSFVGREREIIEIKRTLAMTRLLTLTGVGGSGKTRLALEVARDLVGAYPDGVWLVELASLSEPDLVPRTIAQTMGVREIAGQPLTDTLSEVLRDKEMLLVLDNCEHLVEAAARIVDTLLSACPRLRILATSREALNVAGEVGWLVPAFPVPEQRLSPTVRELEGFEAARLFVERASERRPGFALVPEYAQPVAEICRTLEGIPLAIELGAARIGALSVEQLSVRLADSLKLLTGGGRIQTPRQRTLRGTLDWSHDLLSDPERVLFRRLAVFAGGWMLEAAESVGVGGTVEEDDVLDLLSGLVDKSLVVAKGSDERGVRYRMLEPVRQYARDKLEESGEAEAAMRAHAEHFLALAEEAEPELFGPREAEWFDRLEAEHDNVRAALSWTIERGETETALRLAGVLWQFWFARGYNGEGQRWLEQALTKDDLASAAARAKALEALAWMADVREDMDEAEAAAEEGLRLSEVAGIGGNLTASLTNILGDVAMARGDYERAKELLEESLTLYQKVGDRRFVPRVLAFLGNVSIAQEHYEHAKSLHEEGLALARELGEPTAIGMALVHLGYVFLLEGEHERARALFEEAEALSRELRHKGVLVVAIDNLGWTALLRGDYERAKSYYDESLALCKELGDRLGASESFEGMACISASEEEAARAATLFGAAEALREAVAYQHGPEEEAWREPYRAAARSLLDGSTWDAALAEGRAMAFGEAISYALSTEAPAAPSSLAPDRPSPEARAPGLTRREREVAGLVAQGLTNRRIASELVLSEHTVHHHVTNILKKLNLHSRAQVASRL